MQKQKRIKKNSGVYKIINLVNKKVYIGSSKNLVNRSTNHRKHLSDGKHSNKHLQSSYNKYGGSNFLFEVIEYCDNYVEREQYWMDLLKSYNPKNGYNKRIKAETNNGRLGYKMSEEWKQNISKRQLARRDEIAKWASEFHKGKKVSAETRHKQSIAQKGKIVSKQTRLKISKGLSKQIKNEDLNTIYNSINECCKSLNIARATFSNWITGVTKNPKYKLHYV